MRDFVSKFNESRANFEVIRSKYNTLLSMDEDNYGHPTVSRFAIEYRDTHGRLARFKSSSASFQGLLRGYRQRNLEVSLRACKWK